MTFHDAAVSQMTSAGDNNQGYPLCPILAKLYQPLVVKIQKRQNNPAYMCFFRTRKWRHVLDVHVFGRSSFSSTVFGRAPEGSVLSAVAKQSLPLLSVASGVAGATVTLMESDCGVSLTFTSALETWSSTGARSGRGWRSAAGVCKISPNLRARNLKREE